MRSQRELQSLSITHKASACLYNALKQERTGSKGLLSSIGKQVVGRNKTTSSMTDYIDRRDYNENISGQVRALSNFKPPEKIQKIENMIDNQRENRRQRHLNCLTEFENWHEKLCENIKHSSEETKKNWESFAKASEEELNTMNSSFTEDLLLTKELEYVLAGYDNINYHTLKRLNEAEKMKKELHRLETEKIHSIENFLKLMRKNLIDIAFQLTPEIDTFIALKRTTITSKDKAKRHTIDKYVDTAFSNEERLKVEFMDKLKEKEKYWRKVHHDFTVKTFAEDMKSKKYVNPEERVFMFKELKQKQKEIFDERLELLGSIVELPLDVFTAEKVDQWIEKINTLNEKAQETYDKEIQKLVNFQKKLDSDCDEQLEVLQSKLEYFQAEIDEDLYELIEREGKQPVEALKASGKELLTKAISYLEETDIRANEVCLSLSNYWKSIAKEFDFMNAYNKEEEKKFDLSIAARGDEMDDRVDDLEENYKKEVDRLKRSITLEQLESRLQESFKILDKIEVEYRSYSDDTLKILNSHGNIIKNTFETYLVKVGEKFGLLPMSKKDEWIQAFKEKKLKELEENKIPEEAKKKVGKKEEEHKIDLPIFEEWSYKESRWIILKKQEFILEELLVTEDDKARELERKQAIEEQKRLDEEKRQAEEALKREEAKKGKKPELKKVEEVKIEVPIKEEKTLPSEPIDPEGNLCLETNVYIDLSISITLTQKLRNRAIDYILQCKQSQIESSIIVDKKNIEKTMEELDEHLRYLWPRKGKLEVNEFSTRLVEIKRHFNRWERQLEETNHKKSQNASGFVKIVTELKDSLVHYKINQEELKKQLPSCVNLAECQGLMRRSKDFELSLFQKSDDLNTQAREIYETSSKKIIFLNKEFIKSLQLFENGGQYDGEEVLFYKQKTTAIKKEINDTREKWKTEFEGLMKRLEVEKLEPIKNFEKEYAIVVENIAAKEGMGKKYGAPRRTAQEKLRAEMTRCEKAQNGIEKTITELENLIQEYRTTYASKSEPHFASRNPSLALDLRRTLLTIRYCSHKYGLHISGFKEEGAVVALKTLTWREDIQSVAPSPEEAALEASRLEIMLDPLEDIGVQKNPLNFWQRVLEIEKNAREESLKLFQGKSSAVPDFMEKYLRTMKSNAEDFRLKRVKALRESSVHVIDLLEVLSEAVINSLWFGSEFLFEQEAERCDSKVMVEYEKYEEVRDEYKKMLRPNLSNPSCRKDLEELNKKEEERSNTCKNLIKSSLENFYKSIKTSSELFKIKLLNNTEVFLYIFDNLFTYDTFIPLPGDEQLEIKRSNIKKLALRKKTGKVEVVGVSIHKKNWPGLPLNSLKLPQDPAVADSPILTSLKTPGHKALIKCRNESFRCFGLLFFNKVHEFTHKLNTLLSEEERWNQKWKESVLVLKVKNT